MLVKNTNGALPLGKPRFLSLFGYDAVAQGISMPQSASSSLSIWDVGLMNTLVWRDGRRFSSEVYNLFGGSDTPTGARAPGVALNGTLMFGGGSVAPTPSYIDAPFNAFQQRAREDDTFLAWDIVSQNPPVNPATEACLVFINEQALEGSDRPYLADPGSDILVENVASKCNNTIVIMHNAGIRLVDRWIDNPNITAVIYGHLPGQDTGAALVDIIYGEVSPSGRLPYTVAKNEADYGHLLNPTVPDNSSSTFYTQSNFTEGVDIDYRYFQTANITPRFEFGYGLTYTEFKYSHLQIHRHETVSTAYIPPDALDPTTPAPEGGLTSLWDVVATVTCTIENTGRVAAAEVPQLYVRSPGDHNPGKKRVLRGFDKRVVQPGETVEVAFDLTRRDLSSWDVELQNWVLPEGEYGVMVGESVLKIELEGRLVVRN